jgi:hypothetical protein
VTPYWKYPESQAVVSVHKVSNGNYIESLADDFSQNPVFFFKHSWQNISVSSVPARGGTILILTGVGFDPSFTYVCAFGSGIEQMRMDAFVMNNSRLMCRSPEWPYAASRTRLAIFANRVELVYQGNPEFDFFEGWDAVSSLPQAVALKGPLSGGTVLQVHGYGFNATAKYECIFYSQSNQLSSPAVVMSSSSARCVTPSWGSRYPSSSNTLTAIDIVKHLSSMSLAGQTNVTLPFTNGGISKENTTKCLHSDLKCNFLFYQYMNSSASVPRNIRSSGENITVSGLGFHPNGNYTCMISSTDKTSPKGIASYVDLTTILCPIATWEHAYTQEATLHVWQGTNKMSDESFENFFNVLEVTVSVNPPSVSAEGGTDLTVSGFGFDISEYKSVLTFQDIGFDILDISEYRCRFLAPSPQSQYVDMQARVLNNKQIRCQAPKWPYQRNATFMLLRGGSPVFGIWNFDFFPI